MTRQNRIALIATCVLVLVGSTVHGGQRPVDISKLDEIPIVQPLELPADDAEAALLAYVRKTPAINLDPDLPQIELDSWLTATLLSYNANVAPVEWRLDQCEDFTSDVPGYAAELCTHAPFLFQTNRH